MTDAAIKRAATAAAKAVVAAQTPVLTKDELEKLAEAVAQKVIVSTFKQFGVNLTDDDAVENFRKDMEYSHAWRETIQKGTRTGLLTIMTVAATGFAAIIWQAFRLATTGHF